MMQQRFWGFSQWEAVKKSLWAVIALNLILIQSSFALDVVPDRYLVKVGIMAMHSDGQPVVPSLGEGLKAKYVGTDTLVVEPDFGPATAALSSGGDVRKEEYDAGVHQAWCDAIASRVNAPLVYCEPDFVIQVNATPNDPMYSDLYGMTNISAPAAWNLEKGDRQVVVAVTDTGVDYNHPDLAANMWVNQAEASGTPGVDDDGNGYIDDIHGVNTINNSGNPMDDHGHGTHCAGTIGGVGNNGVGVVGVSWNVRIMGAKFLSSGGGGTTSGAIRAIDYAVNNGAEIINASWGSSGMSTALGEAITRAEQAGVLILAAAGNSGTDNDVRGHYPSNFTNSNIIAVAATDQNDNLTGFSNYGRISVDIAAPGLFIKSTWPGNRYAILSGTSMATPHVAGLAALVKSYAPGLSMLELRNKILNNGDRLGSLNGKVVTGSRINAYGALTGNGSGSGSGGGSGALDVEKFQGHKNTNRLYKNKKFKAHVRGSAYKAVNLTLMLQNRNSEVLGQCSLPSVATAWDGTAKIRGRLSLARKLRRRAKLVTLVASSGADTAAEQRALRKFKKRTSVRSASTKIRPNALLRALSKSCSRVSRSIRSY